MIYLASASPRRQELLQQLGVRFEVLPSNVDETRAPAEPPDGYVMRVARDKAVHVATLVATKKLAPRPVLGADTEVILDGDVLGKPRDREHGLAMLQRLQGRAHDVLTAAVLVHDGREHTALSRSRVTVAALSQSDIARYWDTGEPSGKAGGYAVQGRGAAFIERIEGSYSGVMGLALYDVANLLRKVGIELDDNRR